MSRATPKVLAGMITLALLAGCAAHRRPGQAGGPGALRSDDLDPSSLALAAMRTADALDARPPRGETRVGGRTLPAASLAKTARRVAELARSEKDPAALARRLAAECDAWPVAPAAKVTGYYEPVLPARTAPDARFHYALYRAPSPEQMQVLARRLGRVPTRADIDGRHALAGLGLEIAWTDDPVARFFLHVQGSGRLVFPGGRSRRVGFAGTNGLAYRSVGSVMLSRGILGKGNASAPAMRAWLASQPSRRDALLFENPRYVFFREAGDEGPVGALGATLVAGRSIAVDEKFLPRGAVAWLRTTQPLAGSDGKVRARREIARFVVAQDAGAAIQGAGRVDLFFGSGEDAGRAAGLMNESGELWVLRCDSKPKR